MMTVALASTCLRASPAPLGLSETLSGGVRQYVVRSGDSLTALGARFGVSTGVLAAANHLRPDTVLVTGQPLTIDNRHAVPVAPHPDAAILINVPERMLFLRRDTDAVDAFPLAVGKPDRPTPIGRFRVVFKEEHPTWDVPVSIQEEMRRAGQRVVTRMPPGPRNPLGDYWIGLSFGALGIHGTPSPSSIYRFTTHGCLRLHPDDIKALYPQVAVGATGAIVYEPVLLVKTADGVFLEAHRDAYRRGSPTLSDVRRAAAAAHLEARIDWIAAAEVLRRREGIARAVSLD